jgi:hypothetical protein
MVQDGVEWFGDASPNFKILVESAECQTLQATVLSDNQQIAALQSESRLLNIKLDKVWIQEIKDEIASLKEEIQTTQDREAAAGCPK